MAEPAGALTKVTILSFLQSKSSSSKQDNNVQKVTPPPLVFPNPVFSTSTPHHCGGLCKDRCSLHSRPNVCVRACGTCCVRCKCVPPGTSGNRELCGKCYTDMTTHGNKTKCP
ncbi:hypothetical protein AAG906_001286 [Vitis piasezkii]